MAKFRKGQTGNAGGRPKADPEFRALMKDLSIEAAQRLAQHMRDKKAKHVSVKACIAIIDQGQGRAMQAVQHSGALNLKTDEFEKMSTAELLERARELGVKVKTKA